MYLMFLKTMASSSKTKLSDKNNGYLIIENNPIDMADDELDFLRNAIKNGEKYTASDSVTADFMHQQFPDLKVGKTTSGKYVFKEDPRTAKANNGGTISNGTKTRQPPDSRPTDSTVQGEGAANSGAGNVGGGRGVSHGQTGQRTGIRERFASVIQRPENGVTPD